MTSWRFYKQYFWLQVAHLPFSFCFSVFLLREPFLKHEVLSLLDQLHLNKIGPLLPVQNSNVLWRLVLLNIMEIICLKDTPSITQAPIKKSRIEWMLCCSFLRLSSLEGAFRSQTLIMVSEFYRKERMGVFVGTDVERTQINWPKFTSNVQTWEELHTFFQSWCLLFRYWDSD